MRIKALSLNIFEGGAHTEAIKKFLTEENPDIICLQEVFLLTKDTQDEVSSIFELKKIFPKFYYDFAPEINWMYKDKNILVGNAIFSRFKIKKTNTVFYDLKFEAYYHDLRDIKHDFSDHPRNLQHAFLTNNNTEINIFNTHGIWGFHGNDTQRRLKMGKMIISQIKNKQNVILAGDFNFFPTTQTIKNIEECLKNVFGNKLDTTFNVKLKPHKGKYGNSVVDMMFVSPNIQIIEKRRPDVDVSDHFPLVSILNIPK
jgi:endonuclease/exonuclease/phosphatase family metal-dependent hydrolase